MSLPATSAKPGERWKTGPGRTAAHLLLLLLTSLPPGTAVAQLTLTNGANHSGALLSPESTNTWAFGVTSGNRIILRIGSVDFSPRLDLFTQEGTYLASAFTVDPLNRDATLSLQATNTGVYTVEVRNQFAVGTGTYDLRLVRIPSLFVVPDGDEGGSLPSGSAKPGAMPLGDLDPWSFAASTGDRLVLRIGATNFCPQLDLYGPSGAWAGSATGDDPLDRDIELSISATNTGAFTVVVSSGFSGGTGTYGLHLARVPGAFVVSPGDEGGTLTNGLPYSGAILLGDLDLWRFRGTSGDSNAIQILATNFTPHLRLYDAAGTLVKEAFVSDPDNREVLLSYVVKTNGIHMLIESALYPGQSGTYGLRQSRVPPDLEVNTNKQSLIENDTLSLAMSAQDPDQPDKPLTFSYVSGPSNVIVTQTGITNAVVRWTPAEADGPGTNHLIIGVTDVMNGTAFLGTNGFQVVVSESNRPPVFPDQADRSINEQAVLSVPLEVSDPDVPTNELTFTLLDGPTNALLSTQGVLTWTPTEADGPGTNVFVMMVSDTNPAAINEKEFRTTNTLTVVVNEVNGPPVLETMTNWTANPGQTIQFSAAASDADIPLNTLSFQLVNPPAGAAITSDGLFSWRPALTLANTTNLVQVRVQDNGTPVATDQKSFTVVVNPLAPVELTPIGMTNGTFRFQVDGSKGPDYVIMSSSSITQWTDLTTNLSPATPFEFSDPGAGSISNRAYRVRLGP